MKNNQKMGMVIHALFLTLTLATIQITTANTSRVTVSTLEMCTQGLKLLLFAAIYYIVLLAMHALVITESHIII